MGSYWDVWSRHIFSCVSSYYKGKYILCVIYRRVVAANISQFQQKCLQSENSVNISSSEVLTNSVSNLMMYVIIGDRFTFNDSSQKNYFATISGFDCLLDDHFLMCTVVSHWEDLQRHNHPHHLDGRIPNSNDWKQHFWRDRTWAGHLSPASNISAMTPL